MTARRTVADRPVTTVVAFGALVVLVALNLVAIRFTNRELAPFWNAGARFALAAIVYGLIAVGRRIPRPSSRAVAGSVVYGLFAFAGFFAALYVGLVDATAALGQTVLALGPLVTLLLAAAVGLEPVRGRAVAGAIVGVVGVGIVFGAQEHLRVPITSLLALAAAATSFAAGAIVAKRIPPVDPVWQNAVGTAVGGAVLLTLSRVAGDAWTPPQAGVTWLWFAYLVVPGTVVVFLLYLALLRRLPASVVSYQFILAPLASIALGAVLLDEPAGFVMLIGATVVAAGVYLGALDAARPRPVATGPASGSRS